MKRASVDVLSFLAVFATFYGTLCVVIPAMQLVSHTTSENSLVNFLVGVVMLAGSFLVFRARDAQR